MISHSPSLFPDFYKGDYFRRNEILEPSLIHSFLLSPRENQSLNPQKFTFGIFLTYFLTSPTLVSSSVTTYLRH